MTGTVLGAAAGYALGSLVNNGRWIPIDPSIYFVDHLPVHMQPLDILAVVVASLVVATLAPLFPAYQAGSLEPVTAIRYE
jgi:lipoprotein-releasing system permease protein